MWNGCNLNSWSHVLHIHTSFFELVHTHCCKFCWCFGVVGGLNWSTVFRYIRQLQQVQMQSDPSLTPEVKIREVSLMLCVARCCFILCCFLLYSLIASALHVFACSVANSCFLVWKRRYQQWCHVFAQKGCITFLGLKVLVSPLLEPRLLSFSLRLLPGLTQLGV